MDLRFGKTEKLKSKKLIKRLFSEGRAVSSFPIKLIFIPLDHAETPNKAGVTVPKKNFKSAVTRNRIKRLMREAYRHHKHLVFNNTDARFAFLFLYLGKEIPTPALVEKGINGALERFVKKEIQCG